MIRNSLAFLEVAPQTIKALCVATPNDLPIPKQTIDLGVSEMDKLFVTIAIVLVGSIIIFGPDLLRRLKLHMFRQ